MLFCSLSRDAHDPNFQWLHYSTIFMTLELPDMTCVYLSFSHILLERCWGACAKEVESKFLKHVWFCSINRKNV